MTSPSLATLHIAEQLALILGEESIRTGADGVVTVLPKDTQQVSEVLKYATAKGLTVDASGGSTKQQWGKGATPHIQLSLSRLNRVLDHPWQDLTCTVQAGCTWSSLQQSLARHGQFVALDPLFADRATVGGIIATNDSGALRQHYGSLRDLVIGMTLVLADGTIARTGGRVVKNVAGYDLSKLMTGSMGTLAVITEVNFRLHALPQYQRTFTATASDAARLASLLAAIRASHLLTQALQMRRTQAEAHLDICLTAHPAAQQEMLLATMAQCAGLSLRENGDASCFEREALLAGDSTFIRVSTLPTDTCAVADELQRMSPMLEVISISQGIGLHDVSLRGSGEKIVEVINRLRFRSSTVVTVLQTEPAVGTQAFTVPAAVMSVMQAVKRNFDPTGTLGPGKFFTNA
ncbi:MAG TPA: FAD-binding oxidoreductase [Edaphobacter sp.]